MKRKISAKQVFEGKKKKAHSPKTFIKFAKKLTGGLGIGNR